MHASQLDNILWALGLCSELALLCILLIRKAFRSFPFFFAWICWNILADTFFYVLIFHLNTSEYAHFDIIQFGIQSTLEIFVLFELAANVLAPAKKTFPKTLLRILSGLIAACGVAGFVFAAHANQSTLSHLRLTFVVDNTVAILRLTAFILIAAFAQVLGLNWRNHVLQIASGLAFYAAVSLVCTLLQNRLHAGPNYSSHFQDFSHLIIASYLCALYYWSYAFLRKEAPRKEFNSKMSEFLVSISAFPKQQQSIVARKPR